ncbi:MAG: hypothetical protein AB7L91_13510 [Dehalococcoidia bacterium]
MRPSLRPLSGLDRRVLVLWGAAAVAAPILVTAMVMSSRGGEKAPAEGAPATSTATSTPVFALPALPAGCSFIQMFQSGPGPTVAVGEPVTVTMEAQDCVRVAWEDVPAERLEATLALELDEPDAPAELLVPLRRSDAPGVLRWSGTVTYPLAGNWHGQLRIAGEAVETGPLVWAVTSESGLVARPGLPVPAIEHELEVLGLDRPADAVRWDALESWGMAWIPGARAGEPARVVWVASREGSEWVVAGDPTTGLVTPLFEVELPVSLHGAPDGRAFVAIDRLYDVPKRIRFYDAERAKLVEVGTSRLDTGPVSWAPDSSVVLIGGDRTMLLASDGAPLPLDVELPLQSAAWAPDSTWAIAALRSRPTEGSAPRNEVVRINVGSAVAPPLLDAVAVGRVQVPPGLVISPDGGQFALAWWDPGEPGGKVSVFDRDEALPLRLEGGVVASYPMPDASAQVQWLTSMAWSPDGDSLILSRFEPTDGQIYPPQTSIEVVDVQATTVRLIVEPAQGHYTYGPMWVSADGQALFKQWHSCVGCDGGSSGIDVIDLESGAIVRTVEGGSSLGAVDGVRHLLVSPEGLLSVRGLEAPRMLVAGRWGASTAFTVAPSPDGNRIAVRQTSGRMSPVVAVAPDGLTQTVLGYVRPDAQVVAVRDAATALVLDQGAGWAWASLVDGAVTPLPQQTEPVRETALATAGAISPDRSVAGYWVPGAEKPGVSLHLLDVDTGQVVPAVATSEQTKGLHLTMSPDGSRVLFPDGDAFVTVDVPTQTARRFPYADLGPTALGRTSTATHGAGGTFEVVAGDRLWRLDPLSGDVEVVTDRRPSPGGWGSEVTLSRSPDGLRLVALTVFGLFELQADGSWRVLTGVGTDQTGVGPDASSVVWSPDSKQVAYLGSDDHGMVVVGLDGSGAYELVTQPLGRQMKLVGWLPDGRIVYTVITSGL